MAMPAFFALLSNKITLSIPVILFLNKPLAFGLPCEIFLQISQGEFVFWCLLFGISPVFFHLSDTANPHSADFDPKGVFYPLAFLFLTSPAPPCLSLFCCFGFESHDRECGKHKPLQERERLLPCRPSRCCCPAFQK